MLVLTGIPFRTCWKYGERGWRHLWWDAGCVLANLLAGADAHGIPSQVAVAFADERVAELIGIDGVDEVPLAVVHLGSGMASMPPSEALTPLRVEAEPVAQNVLRFPLVVQAQAGSSFLRRRGRSLVRRRRRGLPAGPSPCRPATRRGPDRPSRGRHLAPGIDPGVPHADGASSSC